MNGTAATGRATRPTQPAQSTEPAPDVACGLGGCGCSADAGATAPDVATDAARPAGITRRIAATTVLGAVAATALAACGGDDEPATTTQPSEGETGSASAGGQATASATAGATAGGSGGDVIAKVADIPVGGATAGQTADGTKIILSQPTAGEVVAFDARCPHQGCTVAPSGDKLACPCHGSSFKIADGSLLTGPATTGLTEVAVKVDGDDVVAG